MKNSVFLKTLKPRLDLFRESIALLNRNLLTRFSFYAVLILLLIGLLAPLFLPAAQHVHQATNPTEKLLGPSLKHPFGTDELGRDLFKKVLLGTRISLQTALVAVSCAVLIGVPLGAAAGFFGGLIDEIMMRITDIFLSFPPLLLAMSIAAFMGPSLRNATLAIAVAWWPWFARIVRGQAVSMRERQFVRAAEAIGTPSYRIIYKHIIPNCIAPIIVQSTMDLGAVILTISSLSFLGLGAQPPQPEWGLIVSTSRNYFLNAWWYSIFPGAAIAFTVLVFNLLGDGLREIMDPRTRYN